MGLGNTSWLEEALCATSVASEVDFYPEDAVGYDRAQRICAQCPVRLMCLTTALEREELWGVWGGSSETERRQVLSLSEDGKPLNKKHSIYCLYCGSEELKVIDSSRVKRLVECSGCGLTWWTRKKANFVLIDEEKDYDDFDQGEEDLELDF